MKFIASTNSLLKELQVIDGVIGNNTVLPILEDFLFELSKGKLVVYSTDLETSMRIELNVETNESGRIAIPAKILTDTLKTLPDQPLTFNINTDKKTAEITSDNGKYKLAGEDGEDFPRLPEPEGLSSIEMSSKILLKAIESTIFATGTDELRPAMTGVLLQIEKDGLTFVSTDAQRLVRFKRSDVKSDTGAAFILPRKALNLLKNSLPDDDTLVKIEYNKSNAFFTFNNIQLICRLIDAKYPDYNAVIPDESPNKLVINTEELLNSLRRVSIYANKSTYLIRLKIKGSELTILAEDIDFSNKAQERLTCQYSGEDLEIGFNAKFLTEMLSSFESEELNFELSNATKAGKLSPGTPTENEDLMMIIMPVMLNVEANVGESVEEA
ncbi:MAG: DNA polymerase III subunit beta [Bacteroidetes bacterium]|nr:DNA polymerase III subunit beta [Bacteroidota bacterium]